MVQLAPLERAQRDAELEEALGRAEFEKRQAEGRELSLAAIIEAAKSVPGRAAGPSSGT